MNPILYALLLSAGTFTGIVACMRLAFWWYGRNPEAHPGDKAEGIRAYREKRRPEFRGE